MDYCKGGRGKKAPYETITVRVPLPVKDKVDKIIEEYKLSLLSNSELKTEVNESENEFIKLTIKLTIVG